MFVFSSCPCTLCTKIECVITVQCMYVYNDCVMMEWGSLYIRVTNNVHLLKTQEKSCMHFIIRYLFLQNTGVQELDEPVKNLVWAFHFFAPSVPLHSILICRINVVFVKIHVSMGLTSAAVHFFTILEHTYLYTITCLFLVKKNVWMIVNNSDAM